MPADTPNALLQTLSTACSDLVADASRHVVAVHSHRSRSSGFVWRPGLIVTADEALAEEGEVQVVFPGGESTKATVVGRDPTTDIALLSVKEHEITPVELGGAGAQPGALVVALGSQEGAPTAAVGAVGIAGPAWRSLRGGTIDARIELDLSLRRAAEGGLVVDAGGQALGMAVFGPRRRVLVIPTATIERVAATLEQHGRIPRGYLGLGLQPVRLDNSKIGAIVMSVDPKGPGAAAGLKQGDILVAWEGSPIESVQSLVRGLGPETIGATVTVSIRRAEEPMDVRLVIGERPKD